MGAAVSNESSTKHPHEPEIAPQLDAEGRCLICGLLVTIGELRDALSEARAYVFNRSYGIDWRAETAKEVLAKVDRALEGAPRG